MMPTKEKKKDESKRRLRGLQLFRRSKSKPAPVLTPTPLAAMPARSISVSTTGEPPLPELFSEVAALRHSADDLSSAATEQDSPACRGRELALSPVSVSLHSLSDQPLQARLTPWDTPTLDARDGLVTSDPRGAVTADCPASNGDGRRTSETCRQREEREQVVRVRKVTTDVDRVTVPVSQARSVTWVACDIGVRVSSVNPIKNWRITFTFPLCALSTVCHLV